MRVIESPTDFGGLTGITLGPGPWLTVTQMMIDDYAELTGDRQWIHVDRARAAREAPGGTTIAHGFLTLSLLIPLQERLYRVENAGRILNYGADRLRFISPVPAGSRIRLIQTVKAAEPVAAGGLRVTAASVIEIEDAPRPALAVETVALFYSEPHL